MRAGSVNTSNYYIYKSGVWTTATQLEYDTYCLGVVEDGAVRRGCVNTGLYYVYENDAWRVSRGAIENNLGACVTNRLGEVGKSENTYYLCTANGWVNQDIAYGTMNYGGKIYKTVKIGTQTWMAENLHYSTSSISYCYDGESSNCVKYGRLYTWKVAKTACPSGWHLPAKDEWESLFSAVGGQDNAGKMLKSVSGWDDGGSGADAYGFFALPAGYWNRNGGFGGEGGFARFWSSTEDVNSNYAYSMELYGSSSYINKDKAYLSSELKEYGCSVRCLQD